MSDPKDPTDSPEQNNRPRVIWVIYGAFLVASVFYAVVLTIIIPAEKQFPDSLSASLENPIALVFILISMIQIPAGIFLPTLLTRMNAKSGKFKSLTQGIITASDSGFRYAQIQQEMIIRLATFESICVFGFISGLLACLPIWASYSLMGLGSLCILSTAPYLRGQLENANTSDANPYK